MDTGSDRAALADRVTARLTSLLNQFRIYSSRIDSCRQPFAQGYKSSAIPLSCPESASASQDPTLAARLRELLGPDDGTVVVRPVWVQWNQSVIGDVMLLRREEAATLHTVLSDLSKLTADGDCAQHGPGVWTEVMNALVPRALGSDATAPLGGALLNQLGVSMDVAKGKATIVHKSPAQMRSLTGAQCKQLSADLARSAVGVRTLLDRSDPAPHLWVPLSVLP